MRLRYRLRIDRSGLKGVKSPLLVIANHQSNLDFISIAATLWPIKLNYVVSTYFFSGKAANFALGLAGAIPKHQFAPDASAIKSMLLAVRGGQSICIFPEGQVGYYGASVGIDPAIGKLIKKLNVPVAVVKLNGGFLSYGKWSKQKYPARMEAKGELLLTKEQVEALSADEIAEAAIAGIAYNDFDWQRTRMIPAKKDRLTDGLENILYRCPKCRKDFVIESRDSLLICAECGYAVRLNRCGFFEAASKDTLVFETAADWFLYQRGEVVREVEAKQPPYFEAECTLMTVEPGGLGYVPRGEGTVTVLEDGLQYSGLRDGKPHTERLYVSAQHTVTHNASVWGVDFVGKDSYCSICPKDSRMMIKIVEYYSAIRKRYFFLRGGGEGASSEQAAGGAK